MPTPSETLSASLSGNPNNMTNPGMNALMTGPNTGIPRLDAIFANSATAWAMLTGNTDMKYIPTVTPGMNLRESYMSRDVTTPLYQTARDQAAYQFGGTFASSLAQVGVTTGVNRMFNMSPDQFRRELVNAGTSPMGRAAMDFLMQQPAMQYAMGGNPMAAAESVFSQRYMLGNTPGGPLLNPLDVVGQTAYAAHASNTLLSLARAAYSGPMGATAALNPSVTQGYNFEEFAYMGLRAAQAGMPGMRGLGVTGDQFAAGNMQVARTMAAVRANMPGSDITQQFAMLEQLGGSDIWRKGDLRGAEASMYEMKALSGMLGGDVLATSTAVSQTLRRAGFDTGIRGSQAIAQRIHAIQNVTGGSTADIGARQTAMSLVGLNSVQGGDTIAMEMMREAMPDDPRVGTLYNNFQRAVMLGSKQEQQQIASRLYSTVSPGLAETLSNPVARTTAFSQILSRGGQANVLRTVLRGQQNEYQERTMESLAARMEGQVGDMEADLGRGYMDTTAVARSAFENSLDRLAVADPSVRSAAAAAKSRLSQIRDPGEQRAAMEAMLETGPLKRYSSAIRTNMARGEVGARLQSLAGSEDDFVAMRQADTLRSGFGNADQVRDLDYIMSGSKTVGERNNALRGLVGRVSSQDANMGRLMSTVAEQSREEWRARQNVAVATTTAMSIAGFAKTAGIDKAIGAATTLVGMTSGQLQFNPEQTRGILENMPFMNDAQKAYAQEAFATGDQAKIKRIGGWFAAGLGSWSQGLLNAEGALGGYFKGVTESTDANATDAAAGIQSKAVAAADMWVQDQKLPGSTTGIQGMLAAADQGKTLGAQMSRLVGVEKGSGAVPKTGAGAGGGGIIGGAGGAGPVQISGTLLLQDGTGYVEGMLNQ